MRLVDSMLLIVMSNQVAAISQSADLGRLLVLLLRQRVAGVGTCPHRLSHTHRQSGIVLLQCATAMCYCRVLLPCVLLRVLLATRASDKLHCFEAMDYIANALNALAQHVDQRPE